MKLPQFETIIIDPAGGSDIRDCKRQAIAVAAEHSCDVAFEHNKRMFKVEFQELINAVRDQTETAIDIKKAILDTQMCTCRPNYTQGCPVHGIPRYLADTGKCLMCGGYHGGGLPCPHSKVTA